MAERAKSDEIDQNKCIRYATRISGTRTTPFFTSQALFATTTASLAKNLYLSRNDPDYVCRVPYDEIEQRAQIIWAAALLSQVCQSSDTTFDDVCDIANPEVAGYLQWVLPDRSISLVEGTSRMLSQLGQRNTYATCGPIFVVLANAIATAECVKNGEKLVNLPKESIPALALRLWSTMHTLLQLKEAKVYYWSEMVKDRMKDALTLASTWPQYIEFPNIRFRCGDVRHRVDWYLNMEVTPPSKEYKEYVML